MERVTIGRYISLFWQGFWQLALAHHGVPFDVSQAKFLASRQATNSLIFKYVIPHVTKR